MKAGTWQRCQASLQWIDWRQLCQRSVVRRCGCRCVRWHWHWHRRHLRQTRLRYHIRFAIALKLWLKRWQLWERLKALFLCLHFPRSCVIVTLRRYYIWVWSLAIIVVPRGIQFCAKCWKRWQTVISAVFGRLNTHHWWHYPLWTEHIFMWSLNYARVCFI